MIFIGMIIVIIAAEYGIKKHMDKLLADDTEIEKGWIRFNLYHNKGMALNVLEKHRGIILMITGTLIGVFLLLLGSLLKTKGRTLEKLGISMILGGAISNYMDRVSKGYVIDYFSFPHLKKIRHIVFNLADLFVFLGGLFVILGQLFGKRR